MVEFLLYSGLSCSDISEIIDRTRRAGSMDVREKVEVVEILQEASPHCPWDAND